MKKNILRIENISVSYGAISALRNVSLEVNEGEFVVLLGSNGAGKSTLVETVIGINRASSGHIDFLGKDITRRPTDRIVALGITLVPERRAILGLMTVLENLQLGAYHLKGDINERLTYVCKHFPVLEAAQKMPGGFLSGGQQQMLSVGRGLMSAPKLMMVDEPSLGLAPLMIEEVFKTLAELNKEGCSILVAEQNARKALQYAHRGYVLETGEVALSGTANELIADPKLRQAYLGV